MADVVSPVPEVLAALDTVVVGAAAVEMAWPPDAGTGVAAADETAAPEDGAAVSPMVKV